MPEHIEFDTLLATNPKVDADRLTEYCQLVRRLGRDRGDRYRYNLVSPFAGRMNRQPAAECKGPDDNIKKPH